MKIKSLKLKDFGLLKEAEIFPQQINCIKGINHDNPADSSNGSAKSTLGKLAIIFLLYGEAYGKTLNRLIHFGNKECSVIGELLHQGEHYKIIRKIPNKLQIYVDGVEQTYNTPTIAQNYLNGIFGDYDFFKKYCLVDNKGINLLDSLDDSRSVVSFKKELIQFINNECEPIRQSLLDKKNDREKYGIDKRLYKFHLSEKRKSILENGLLRLEETKNTTDKDIKNQRIAIKDLEIQIKNNESQIGNIIKANQDCLKDNLDNEEKIDHYKTEIAKLQNIEIKPIIEVDYDSRILKIEYEIDCISKNLEETDKEDLTKKAIKDLTITIHDLEIDINNLNKENDKLLSEIDGLNQVQIGTKCDRCGSLVSKEYKESYYNEKMEKVTNNKETISNLQETYNNEKMLLKTTEKTLNDLIEKRVADETILKNLRNELKNLNNKKSEYNEELRKVGEMGIIINSETEKYNKLMESYKNQTDNNIKKINENNEEIKRIENETKQLKTKLVEEENCMEYYNSLYEDAQKHVEKTKEKILKLNEAFKFSEYKYTASDIQLYADSIKTWDSFSGYFIKEWMDNLTLIINDLLSQVNLSIEITNDKEFLKIKDGNETLLYSDLSSGQQTFFSAIFKLSILLQRGESNKIIIMDDGLGDMDEINFKNLINICKNIPMQFFIIFQNCPEIEEINYINVERKNGESKVK